MMWKAGGVRVLGFGEGVDDFVEFVDGGWPAVLDQEGDGVGAGAGAVDEVDAQRFAVGGLEGGAELGEAVELGFDGAPVEVVGPVCAEFL